MVKRTDPDTKRARGMMCGITLRGIALVGMLPGVIAAVVVVITWGVWLEVQNGSRTFATVDDRIETFTDSGSSYSLAYRYTAADGSAHQRRESVSGTLFESVAVGDQLEIVYAPNNPGNARVAMAAQSPGFEIVLTILAVGWIAFWLLFYFNPDAALRLVALFNRDTRR